jgi:hypothetical protein
LGTALSSNFDYHGKFYFSKKMEDIRSKLSWFETRDPEISVEGLGKIKLPLETKKQANAIIEFAKRAPFGKGEETVVDTKVRDTWEIDGSKVTIGNTKWKQQLETTVLAEVCMALGVDMGKSTPRLELYKLLLYTEGSQ